MVEGGQVEPLQPGSLLLVLREAQAQHGLRHGDYARYRCDARAGSRRSGAPADAQHCRRARRQYCARRLLRLYQMLGFSHGGGKAKYQNRTLGAADVTDGRCVGLTARCAKTLRR